MPKNGNTILIGITGISGSGKSFLSKHIQTHIPTTTIYALDYCYKTIGHIPKDKLGFPNFDLPASIDLAKAQQEINRLLNVEPVVLKSYNYNNPKLKTHQLELNNKGIIVIDGLFINLLDLKWDLLIYIDVPLETALARRIDRDALERKLVDVEEINYQWKNHVLPSFDRYILPLKSQSDLILDSSFNDLSEFEKQLGIILEKIEEIQKN